MVNRAFGNRYQIVLKSFHKCDSKKYTHQLENTHQLHGNRFFFSFFNTDDKRSVLLLYFGILISRYSIWFVVGIGWQMICQCSTFFSLPDSYILTFRITYYIAYVDLSVYYTILITEKNRKYSIEDDFCSLTFYEWILSTINRNNLFSANRQCHVWPEFIEL